MADSVNSISGTIRRWRRFLRHDVWQIGRPGERAPDGFIIKQIRVAVLLVQNFIENKLLLRAAALTFVSLLSIVPVLALMYYAIMRFDLGEGIYEMVTANVEWRDDPGAEEGAPVFPDAVDAEKGAPVVQSAAVAEDQNRVLWTNFLSMVFRGFIETEDTLGETDRDEAVQEIVRLAERSEEPGALGIAGGVFVLIVVIGLIRNIESSFNSIWGLKNTRSWYRMFSDYLVVIFMLPLFVGFALTVTTLLESDRMQQQLGSFAFALRGVQYVLIWFAFTALYFIVPNTRVRIRYALFSGVIAGTAWCLMSYMYVNLQIGSGRLDTVYTSFAAIPLLIMWIYFSWIILLLGAELTYAYQNEKTFAMERWASGASYAYREAVAVRAMIEIARRFDAGEPGMPANQAAEEWHVPTRLLNETLDQLEDAGLVAKCATDPVTYVPARSLDRIDSGDVIAAIREAGRDPSELRQDPELRQLLEHVAGTENDAMRKPVTDWVRRMHPPRQVLPAGDTDHNILQLNDSAKDE